MKSRAVIFAILLLVFLVHSCIPSLYPLYTKEKMLLTKQKLMVLMNELPPNQFLQIHRSHIISISGIEYLEGNMVQVAGKNLPISAGYRQAVLAALG